MIYKPSSKIGFGVHKGFEISKIYQFDPSYLEWAIKFVPTFEIDITEFEKLPKPTPYDKTMSLYQISNSDYGYCIDSEIQKSEIHLQTGNKFKEIDFAFSKFSEDVLKQKKEGKYVCPTYEKVKFQTIKIEDLF